MKRTLVVLTVLFAAATVCAQDLPGLGPPAQLRLPGTGGRLEAKAVASHTTAAPGQRFHVAVELTVPKGWVYYSPRPGKAGGVEPIAAGLAVSADTPALRPGEPLWPVHHAKADPLSGGTLNVYQGSIVVYVPVAVAPDAPDGTHVLTFEPTGQICSDAGVCKGVRNVLASVELNAGERAVANPNWTPALTDGLSAAVPAERLESPTGPAVAAPGTDLSLWAGLGLAVLAGLTLNIMPCVLPILPLRILTLVEMARQSRRRYVTLGMAFAAGVVLFFAALGAVNVVLKLTASRALDINEHFKYAPVRIAIAMVLLALAGNLFGLFTVTVPLRLASRGQRQAGGGHVAAVGMGFMLAVLATPCSFFYLAAALGWAQVQPLWLGTLVILVIGAAMALPHAVLAAFPDLLKWLPRPGRWMELFRHAMGFLLLLAVVWLLQTLSEQSYPFWVAGYGVVLVMCLWIWGTWVRYDAPLRRKLLVRGGAVVLAAGLGIWMLSPPGSLAVTFEPFDAARITEARSEGRTVLLKFTASWCVSCKWVDLTIYDDDRVAEELEARGVLAMRGDVTSMKSPAARMLEERFRGSPPLTVIFPSAGGEPIFLVGKFSRSEFFAALDKARPAVAASQPGG